MCHLLSARLHIDVIICDSAGGILNLGEQAGDTGKRVDTGHYMTWGGGIFALVRGGWRGLGRKSAAQQNTELQIFLIL